MNEQNIYGIVLTILASLWWGVIGVFYFKYVSFTNPIELVVHRTIWTLFILIFTTLFFSKLKILFKIMNNKKLLCLLFLSGLLIMTNWLTWLYAISSNRLIDASLGYYIFPILSVFFGIFFLKEKYNRNKILSVLLVFFSIIYLIIHYQNLPWIGLTVAITFSLYGLIRKKINVDTDIGLLIETLLLSPFAIIVFYYLVEQNLNIFSFQNINISFLLLWAGPMTLIPLYLYSRGFQLVGIGAASMIFFLTPTAQFILGIFYYGETLDVHKLISFIVIWIAVSIYINELRKE